MFRHCIAGIGLGFALCLTSIPARADSIQVGTATDADCTFFCATMYQQVYASNVFSGPVDITSVSLVSVGAASFNGSTWTMTLSQSAYAVGDLSTTFTDNISANAAVFATQTFTGPSPAGSFITFSGSYLYDPSLGPLLATIQLVSGSPGDVDVQSGIDENVYSRAFAFNDSTNADIADDGPYYGDVTVFGVSPVGVPGPVLGADLPGLLCVGAGLLGWWRRKRKAEVAQVR